MANIHDLGLGVLKLLTNQIEKDNGFECWGDLEPHAKNWLGEVFPNANIEIHPLVSTVFNAYASVSEKRQKRLTEIANKKLLEAPEEKKEEIKSNGNRPRGYNNI